MRILLVLGPFLALIGGLAYMLTAFAGQAGLDPRATPVAAAPASTPARMPAQDLELSQVTQVSARTMAPAPGDSQADAAMRNLTAGVLSGLGQPVATVPNPAGPPDEMQTMTASVLAALGGTDPTAAGDTSLQGLVEAAMREGQSDSYLDTLINEAADAGQIRVPAALRNAEGRVDTAALIAAIAQAASGSATGEFTQVVLPTGDGVEVRLVAESGGAMVPYYFYTVQVGDSLGAIAQNFYGDAAEYTRIYDANRRLLSTPNRIRQGQRLRIPGLI